nr:uncharacterized protein LOC113829602 [Penaeus vannamei]
MIKLAWAVTCLVVWAGVSQVSVGVRLENGRYEDVVLAVDPAMGTDVISITDLEKKVKTLLQATSDSLHAATEGRLSLGSVRVVIPQTWNAPDDLLEDPVEGVSWGSADIRLEEPEKDYRGNYVSHTPHTLQPGQCGVPGRHITIHTTLLDADYAEANYGSQGAVMAHEWAHFRWGVMEEHGFPGDGVFPVHYSRGGQDELPTSCFAGDLEGKFETEKGEACDPGAASPACYFLPSGSSTNGSLMYLTHLSDGHFCKRNTHNPWAPTPQNIHCGRRSVWEVLETHDDFTQTSGSHATPAQVAVTFHKPQTPRIFLLFDPPLSEESAAIISDLVKSKIQDLSRKFQSFDVGMATCRLVGENVELIKKREFSPVADVNSLDEFMPAVSDRESDKTVPLDRLWLSWCQTWTDHTPGTLLMALVYNHVSGEEAAAVDSTLLQATSDSLHAATEGRLSLGSVRVVLPQTWNAPDDLLEDPVEGVSWGSADIRLEEPEKDYRGNYVSHTPHTLQPGQCGVPGRHITIHTTLLDADYAEANYGSQGAVMAHEWAHFRWGVMEEHGFPGDGVFPVHYSRGGQDELPTSCFAGDLEGKFETEKGEACDPGAASPACYFLPSGSSTNGSLMYLTHLSDGHFCTRNTHNPWAPTPQNVHCGRRSVWEVLETHDDFTQTSGSHATPAQVAVTFHKPQTPRIFLLFDPPLSEESAAIISDLVKSKIQDLSRKFQSFAVGMATCRLVGENVELIKKREFSPVADVNSLDEFMPAVSDRESNKTVPLGRAVAQLVPTWTDHTPGTLLMALVYNHVSGEEAAAVDSEILLKKKVKMLLLDGLGNLENLPTMAPLLQETGGRIYSSSNATANIIHLLEDFERYFSSSHLDDHIVYGVSTTEIKNGITTVGKIQLDAQGLSYLNLVIKIDSFDPEKFNVILRHPVAFRDIACGSEDAEKFNFFCGNFDGGIYASFQTTGIAGSDVGYEFKVSSTSQQSHAATVTWSTVEDIDNPMVRCFQVMVLW